MSERSSTPKKETLLSEEEQQARILETIERIESFNQRIESQIQGIKDELRRITMENSDAIFDLELRLKRQGAVDFVRRRSVDARIPTAPLFPVHKNILGWSLESPLDVISEVYQP